jgi:hypothetical protein
MSEPQEPLLQPRRDRIYPRCVWCDGENYALAVMAYSCGLIPCAAAPGCGRYLPRSYWRDRGEVSGVGGE